MKNKEPSPPQKSETRKRSFQVLVRFTPDEWKKLDARCEHTRLSRAAFLRRSALGSAGPRSKRSPSFDHLQLEKLTGALQDAALSNTRIGTNLNQIAHQLNAEGLPEFDQEVQNLLLDLQDVLTSIITSIEDGQKIERQTYLYLRKAMGYDH